jgi:hypothetical protein
MSAVAGILGDDIGELISTLTSWGAQIRAARGYLPTGPHDLAAADPILRSPRAT